MTDSRNLMLHYLFFFFAFFFIMLKLFKKDMNYMAPVSRGITKQCSAENNSLILQ